MTVTLKLAMAVPAEWRRALNDDAFRCNAASFIFGRKAAKVRLKLKALAFLGIAAPAALGSVATFVKLDAKWLPLGVLVVSVLGLIQLIFSIWSLVSRWDDSLSYYVESKEINKRLADSLSLLANNTTHSKPKFLRGMEILEVESGQRQSLDSRWDISSKEKKVAMHASLWKFQRECAICSQKPMSEIRRIRVKFWIGGCGTCGQISP